MEERELRGRLDLTFLQIYLINQGKDPNGGIGLKDVFEETIFNNGVHKRRPDCQIKKAMGLFLLWGGDKGMRSSIVLYILHSHFYQ
jgi:hypothetical protein